MAKKKSTRGKKRGILDGFISQVVERVEDIVFGVMDAVEDAVFDTVEEHQRQAPRPPKVSTGRATKVRKNFRRPNTVQRPTPPQITSYEVLEVSRNASHETISAAFRSLSTKYHPDNKDTGNNDRYADMTAAWQNLKTVDRRREYDREIGLG